MIELTAAERVFAKIPDLKPEAGFSAVHISKFQFVRLSDDEFSFLYYAPGMVIHVSKSTAKYIEKRRRYLRLMKPSELPPLPGKEGT